MCRDFQGSHTQSSFLKEVDFSTKANAQKKKGISYMEQFWKWDKSIHHTAGCS